MGLAVTLVENDSLRVTPAGSDVQVRLNWYRSIPLSCIEQVRVALNGRWARPETFFVRVDRLSTTMIAR